MAGFNPSTWPTFQQSMPIAQGAMTGEQLLRAHLQNQQQRQQNQFQPDLNAANLARTQALTQGQNISNQFQPDLNTAKLSQMKSATQGQDISNEQAPEILALREYMSKNAARNARTGEQNILIQKQKMPAFYLNSASRAQNIPGVLSAEGDRSDPSLMLNLLKGVSGFGRNFADMSGDPNTSMGAPFRQQTAPQQQQSPQQQQQSPQQQEQSQRQMALQQAQQAYQQSLQPAEQQPKFPALQQYMQSQQAAGAQQQPQQPMQQQQQPMPPQQQQQQQQPAPQQQQGIPLDVLANAQRASRDSQEKRNTTANILNQRQYSMALDKLIDSSTPDMTTAINAYSGLAGTERLAKDKSRAALGGENSVTPELQSFYNTRDVATQYLKNEVTRSQGEAHNLATSAEMKKLVNPIYWNKNPKLALGEWDSFIKKSHVVSKALANTLSETEDQLRAIPSDQTPQAQPSSSPSVTAAPAGTVDMINPKDGKVYHMKSDQAEDAIASAGWRRA